MPNLIMYTCAPSDYDYGYTTDTGARLDGCDSRGLRVTFRILTCPEDRAGMQIDRYRSGLYLSGFNMANALYWVGVPAETLFPDRREDALPARDCAAEAHHDYTVTFTDHDPVHGGLSVVYKRGPLHAVRAWADREIAGCAASLPGTRITYTIERVTL